VVAPRRGVLWRALESRTSAPSRSRDHVQSQRQNRLAQVHRSKRAAHVDGCRVVNGRVEANQPRSSVEVFWWQTGPLPMFDRVVYRTIAWIAALGRFLLVDIHGGPRSELPLSRHHQRHGSRAGSPADFDVPTHKGANTRRQLSPRPSQARALSLAAPVSIAVGIIGTDTWWYLAFPVGLLLAAAAWFKGDRLGISIVLFLLFVLQVFAAVLAMMKYG
jgi:hypothetical protein